LLQYFHQHRYLLHCWFSEKFRRGSIQATPEGYRGCTFLFNFLIQACLLVFRTILGHSRYEIKVLKHQFIPRIDTELILRANFRFVYAQSLKVRFPTSLRIPLANRGYHPLFNATNCGTEDFLLRAAVRRQRFAIADKKTDAKWVGILKAQSLKP
jgi:hypothetical protein